MPKKITDQDLVDDFAKTKDHMSSLAKGIDHALHTVRGKRMGFVLLVFDDGTPSIMNYVSNSKRHHIINALREAAKLLESGKGGVSVEV